MLINKKYDYRPLERVSTEKGRRYIVGEGRPLPSVTTILSKTADHSYLEEWRNNVGHAAASRITAEASSLGTGLHNNLENYILDKPLTGSFMQQGLAKLIIKKGLCKVNEVWGTEISLYSKGLYAGTADLIGKWINTPAIMDFKNSLREKKLEYIEDYRAQLAGYALAHNEMYGTDIHCGVVMIATRDAKYQEFVFEGAEFGRCIDIWLRRLDQYYGLPENLQ